MSVTIKDVAALANVSVGTVSKFINGEYVKEKNRENIESAIKKLHYKPNRLAKGLRQSRTYTVVLLMESLNRVFLVPIINSIENYLSEKGYSLIVCDCQGSLDVEYIKVKQYINRMVDGFIILPCNRSEFILKYIQEKKIPMILLDKRIEGITADTVILDNKKAVYDGTMELIRNGHKKIAIISGDKEHYSARERVKGYKQALIESGIELNEDYIVNGHYDIKGGQEAFIQLWSMKDKPSAIVISNYDMTLGSIIEINHNHIKIPEEVSLIALDLFQLTEVIQPTLSVLEAPWEEMGVDIARLLYQRIEKKELEFPQIVTKPAKLIKGKSVKNMSSRS